MDKKRALGKGLAALIPDDFKEGIERDLHREVMGDAAGATAGDGSSVFSIRTEEVAPGRFQPRSSFNDEKLQELISSIKENGVIQPLLVRKAASGYELIAGERRLRAAKTLGIKEIPAIVKSVSDKEALVYSIIENVQREELNPIEEARAFMRLIDEFNFTQDVVAQSVGKDRSSVSNTLRLLKLPQEIQNAVSRGDLSMGHARALLSLTSEKDQLKLTKVTVSKGLSVRELENLVKRYIGEVKTSRRSTGKKSLEIIAVEEKLQQALGTKVRITAFKKRGKILIDYYSDEDLNRITEVIAR